VISGGDSDKENNYASSEEDNLLDEEFKVPPGSRQNYTNYYNADEDPKTNKDELFVESEAPQYDPFIGPQPAQD